MSENTIENLENLEKRMTSLEEHIVVLTNLCNDLSQQITDMKEAKRLRKIDKCTPNLLRFYEDNR